MKQNWEVYCLMCSIAYIEEMSKPTEHIQIKGPYNKKYLCFHSVELRMKDEEFVKNFFETTKLWGIRKGVNFIGKSFTKPRKDKTSKQDTIYLSPLWLNYILAECGKIPNKYSFETAIKRINNFKVYKISPIKKNKNLFNLLLKNRKVAAGAFIISMDLEFRGVQQGRLSLCMSEKYKDFLEFMLKVAKKWRWTNNKTLSPVSIAHATKRGINASPQYEFRINIKGLQEIYALAGPLTNSHKDKCTKFHVNRSKNFIHKGYRLIDNKTREKIFEAVNNNKNITTTELQFFAGVGVDVVLRHLHKLEEKGKIRKGKRYVWNIK